jgi:Na+-transporting methylmalonyl-CoA/oxaloacetate decarboxylase gamma subunit
MENIGILDAGIIALLGYAVVFFGIILLMIVVMIMGKIFVAAENKKKKAATPVAAPAAAPVAPVAPVAPAAPVEAPGTAGQLKLYDTPPKTAAMIMAIVADKMGKPLNELRFISIKEVKE